MSFQYRLTFDEPCIDHKQVGNTQGYGHSGSKRLHRVVFKREYGFLPSVVMHTCDNPRCINPAHLVPGTHAENNKDRAKKGRSAKVRYDLRRLSFEQAEQIRTLYSGKKRDSVNGVADLAKKFGVDINVIYNIVSGRTHLN